MNFRRPRGQTRADQPRRGPRASTTRVAAAPHMVLRSETDRVDVHPARPPAWPPLWDIGNLFGFIQWIEWAAKKRAGKGQFFAILHFFRNLLEKPKHFCNGYLASHWSKS